MSVWQCACAVYVSLLVVLGVFLAEKGNIMCKVHCVCVPLVIPKKKSGRLIAAPQFMSIITGDMWRKMLH